jgi:microcystin-dependent protein
MSEPFLAEIRIMGFNFPPRGWATCDGQILPINQNQSLYSLLGTTYGGDGRTTFALPDLRGRVPVHPGADGVVLGERSGEETHTLTVVEMPSHTHAAQASSAAGTTPIPNGNVLASTAPSEVYHEDAARLAMRTGTVGNVGASQPHENMQPYTTLNFCIALQGLFPSRN